MSERDERDTEPPPPSRPEPTPEQRLRNTIEASPRVLAPWCAEWAHRGVGVDDLVGLIFVPPAPCHRPLVLRRVDVEREHPHVARALRTTPRRAGRLDMVIVFGDEEYEVLSVGVPAVEVPDTRGMLPSLSPEERACLEARIDFVTAHCGAAFKPWTFEAYFHTLYGFSQPGSRYNFELETIRRAPHGGLLAAADFPAHYRKLPVLVEPNFSLPDLPTAVVWVDPTRFGIPFTWKLAVL